MSHFLHCLRDAAVGLGLSGLLAHCETQQEESARWFGGVPLNQNYPALCSFMHACERKIRIWFSFFFLFILQMCPQNQRNLIFYQLN
uniref:Uncharacterized protein n=1 Tax=Anguilla anguilla TaxID=7936 RepID=A0A0E9Q4B8_ANGAN